MRMALESGVDERSPWFPWWQARWCWNWHWCREVPTRSWMEGSQGGGCSPTATCRIRPPPPLLCPSKCSQALHLHLQLFPTTRSWMEGWTRGGCSSTVACHVRPRPPPLDPSKCGQDTVSQHHHKMKRHRPGPGLCLFGVRSVSVTQTGRAVCVSAALCRIDTLRHRTVFSSVAHLI